jgi:glyoxylase-like metal-dependent hydrolase (beta-lactamase superfamily II)
MSHALPGFVEALGHGIYCIDSGFQRAGFDAVYLITHAGRAAFVDTATNFAVPRMLETLDALSIPRDNVDCVIPTHVHLDHAGGTGALIKALPNARVLVHPRGTRHLIDPSKLYLGALAVYGPAIMARDYGELEPVPEARVVTTHDGYVLDFAGRPLTFLDTPGHARHHHCIWDETSRGIFTGDTFGLSYRELATHKGPWTLITSTPVQFEPDALRESIARLLALAPSCIYLTHFGKVELSHALVTQQLGLLDRMVELGHTLRTAPERHHALKTGLRALYETELRAHGSQLSSEAIYTLLEQDIELNAQGMGVWLDREAVPAT